MKFPIEIEIPESEIAGICESVVRGSFRPSGVYGETSNTGYETVRLQVEAYLGEMDFTEQIKAVTTKLLKGGLMTTLVETALRSEIKKQIAKIRKEGNLFDHDPHGKLFDGIID